MSLRGKHLLVTKTEDDCGRFGEILEKAELSINYFPTIEILPAENQLEISRCIENLNDFDFLIFPSANSVKYFVKAGGAKSGNLFAAAVGSKTKRVCEELGMAIDIVPEEFSAHGLLKHFAGEDIAKKKILIPSSEIARNELSDGLRKLGAEVEQITFYRNVPKRYKQSEIENTAVTRFEIFAFTSPSSFRGFLKLFGIRSAEEYFSGKIVAAIGNTTRDAIIETNTAVQIIPRRFTMDALAEAIRDYVLKLK